MTISLISGQCVLLLFMLINLLGSDSQKDNLDADPAIFDKRGNTFINKGQVMKWADSLGEMLKRKGDDITQIQTVINTYKDGSKYERYDPEQEIEKMNKATAQYMKERTKLVWNSKMSLEQNQWLESDDLTQVNNLKSDKLVRFISAKTGNDFATLPVDQADMEDMTANMTKQLHYKPNVNFYMVNVSTEGSAVHVPVPVYERSPKILRKIEWSNIDQYYRRMKTIYRDLSWQYFCSEAGFMRYFPAKKWVMDDSPDLFDCRNTEWYLDGATNPKHIVIMLDISGSMLGQRFETFNDKVKYFEDCLNGTLVQSTMRNKKMMRMYLNNATSVHVQGIAGYEAALEAAFSSLLGYNATANWTSAEWIKKNGMPDRDKCIVYKKTLEGDVMCLDENYIRAISEATYSGCNYAIMLITDGASDAYTELIGTLNDKEKVRFFSYLIGEEATNFAEVREMACTNNGFMTQVQNLADAQEKVQHYIRVMSRPVEYNPDLIQQAKPIWTGVYMDRLYWHEVMEMITFNSPEQGITTEERRTRRRSVQELKMVTTVAFPVVRAMDAVEQKEMREEEKKENRKQRNSTNAFMGVAGLSVPMIELQQKAPIFKLGANAYTFLIDNNGAGMFHPQLRPFILDRVAGTVTTKPNYNSIDLTELEVLQKFHHERLNKTIQCADNETLPYNSTLRTDIVDGKSSQGKQYKQTILFALTGYSMDDRINRVYEQHQTYHFRAIPETMFTLVLANPIKSDLRVSVPETYDYSKHSGKDLLINKQWRLHPEWRYCMRNDSWNNETGTQETSFVVYYKQILKMNALPDFCKDRKDLVTHLMYDIEQTGAVMRAWETAEQAALYKQSGVNIVFVVTQSGFMRYKDNLLKDLGVSYADPNWVPPAETTAAPPLPASNDTTTGMPFSSSTPDPEIFKPQDTYAHWTDRYTRGPDEPFYQQTMLYKWMYPCPKTNTREGHNRNDNCHDLYHFNISFDTRVFFDKPFTSKYNRTEQSSLLVSAYKPLFLLDKPSDGENSQRAPIGVAGYEMVYDNFVDIVNKAVPTCAKTGAKKQTENLICYLLDDSGYVVYTSDEDMNYADPFTYDQQELYRPEKNTNKTNRWKLGRFYASISPVENGIMYGLVESKFFIPRFYIDYQAVCEITEQSSMAIRLMNPFIAVTRLCVWLIKEMAMFLTEYSFWAVLYGMFRPTAAYTPTFTFMDTTVACDKGSYFYTLNQAPDAPKHMQLPSNPSNDPEMKNLNEGGALKPCGQMDCSAFADVALVPYTNMILVIQWSKGPDCFKDRDCLAQAEHQVNHTFEAVTKASDKQGFGTAKTAICKATEPRHRRAPEHCWTSRKDDGVGYVCSSTIRQLPSNWMALATISFIAIMYNSCFSFSQWQFENRRPR